MLVPLFGTPTTETLAAVSDTGRRSSVMSHKADCIFFPGEPPRRDQRSDRLWDEIVMIQEAQDVGDKALTLRKLPGRITLDVISSKKHSIRLSQDEEVGMKWM